MNKKQPQEKDAQDSSFERFETLAKNLMAVSNAEVREKMAEEKRKKSKKKRPAK
jgi:hypothetical protein